MDNSYQVVADILGARESRKVANNSYLVQTEGKRDREGHPGQRGTIAYKLHNTYVVLWHDNGAVELNSGGWRTVTTKDRINSCLRDYDRRGFGVWSDRGVWTLYRHREPICAFADGMFIHADGSVTGGEPIDRELKALAKWKALIDRYLKGLTPKLVLNLMSGDGLGDCFYCRGFVSQAELVNGRLQVTGPSTSTDHLVSHLKERYYMRALFMNALQHVGAGPAWSYLIVDRANEGTVDAFLKRALRRYFMAHQPHNGG